MSRLHKRNIRVAKSRQSNHDKDTLERIDTISKNARGLWFGLLAALVFSGITLLRIEDIDFFGVNRTTQLPLVGVSVPVTAFFAAGGALTTAIYVYFHLYLVQLFEALGEVEPMPKGIPLSKSVYPWMVTDALIRWRSRLRDDDGSAARRALGRLSSLVSFVVVWLFGLGIIWYFWWRSMPAHNEAMTLLLGVLLVLALWVGNSTIFAARDYLAGRRRTARALRLARWPMVVIITLTILPLSWIRTEGGLEGWALWYSDWQHETSGLHEFERDRQARHDGVIATTFTTDDLKNWLGFAPLSAASMPEKHLAELPNDWRDIDLARKWFRQDLVQTRREKPSLPEYWHGKGNRIRG